MPFSLFFILWIFSSLPLTHLKALIIHMCVIYLFMCVYLGFADWFLFYFNCLWNSWLKDISFFDGWWPDTSALVAEDMRVSGCHTHSVLWTDWTAWWSSFVCSGAEQALRRLVPHYLISALHIQAPTIRSAVRFYWLWMALDFNVVRSQYGPSKTTNLCCVFCLIRVVFFSFPDASPYSSLSFRCTLQEITLGRHGSIH